MNHRNKPTCKSVLNAKRLHRLPAWLERQTQELKYPIIQETKSIKKMTRKKAIRWLHPVGALLFPKKRKVPVYLKTNRAKKWPKKFNHSETSTFAYDADEIHVGLDFLPDKGWKGVRHDLIHESLHALLDTPFGNGKSDYENISFNSDTYPLIPEEIWAEECAVSHAIRQVRCRKEKRKLKKWFRKSLKDKFNELTTWVQSDTSWLNKGFPDSLYSAYLPAWSLHPQVFESFIRKVDNEIKEKFHTARNRIRRR